MLITVRNLNVHDGITGRYMQLALRTARTFWLKRTVKWLAVRPAPAPAGDSLKVSRFLPTRELSNNRITLHRTTSAKTRATSTLRQLHIPPNVSRNFGKYEKTHRNSSGANHG